MGKLWAAFLTAAAGLAAEPGRVIAERYYTALIERGAVTGAYFAEVTNGAVVESAVFGNAHADSLWRAASTSKTLTAVGVMKLVERGQLDLDADVNRYLRTLKVPATKSKAISLRRLLSHTAGLDDPFVGSGFLAADGPAAPLARVMKSWMPARLYEPGEVRLYSNFGYGLAGAVIEEATGRRFEDFMREEVLGPLGMEHSTFRQPLPQAAERNVVPSMERSALGSVHPADIIYHRATPAGGLTTTAADLVRLVRFVQNRGAVAGIQLLQPDTLHRMLGESYGFGTGTSRGQKYWYAGGDLGGYHTVILWFPEHNRALVTMAASASNMATWNLVPQVMQSWFGPEKKEGPVTVAPFAGARAAAERVAGIYRPVRYPHHDLGKTFTVNMDQPVRANDDGSIVFSGERWIAVDPQRFRNATDARELTFQADAAGRVRLLNREYERIAWYQSGRAAIAFYFAFVAVSAAILWLSRRRTDGARPLRWMAATVLLHSVAWLGAVLWADPQRLILGSPWYLDGALALGAAVPGVWACLAVSTGWTLLSRQHSWADRLSRALATLLLGLYVPFITYWQLTALPVW